MAWNRPQSKSTEKAKSKRPTLFVLCGLMLLALLGTIFLVSRNDQEVAYSDTEDTALIKVVQPNLKTNVVIASTLSAQTGTFPYVETPTWQGSNAIPTTSSHKPKARLVKRIVRKGDIEWLFENSAECEIQRLLELEPGDEIFAPSDYRTFERDFDKSIKKPITFYVGEERDKAEKRAAVKEIRDELAARRAKGEDIAQIMRETQDELIKAGEYKSHLKAQILEMRRDKANSAQDIVDFVEAANVMLREKGISEMKCPSLWKYKARKYLESAMEGKSK